MNGVFIAKRKPNGVARTTMHDKSCQQVTEKAQNVSHGTYIFTPTSFTRFFPKAFLSYPAVEEAIYGDSPTNEFFIMIYDLRVNPCTMKNVFAVEAMRVEY